ncbi:MAG: hypothetical protein JJE04_20675 [Acidobacteriia bacterium]|nr:hypothetical protein [Terriglobia bacterium]
MSTRNNFLARKGPSRLSIYPGNSQPPRRDRLPLAGCYLGCLLLALASVTVCLAQAGPASRSSLKVNLPADSPVTLLSADWGESSASERGSAMVLNLHTSLSLRNSSSRRIRGITWMVLSQEVTPGGRASVTKASLDIAPGEAFPVRLDLRLLRPLAPGQLQNGAPLVQMSLDGVLFEDLSFYGPNRLESRRSMTAMELEAQRDRRHFLQVLSASGAEALRKECLASLARQADTPRLDVQLARGRATAVEQERQVQFAFLRFPGAPVDPVAGMAQVAGGEARAPQLEVHNKSSRAVKSMEIGWLLRDSRGREFWAGTVPARASLSPGQKTEVLGQTAFRFAEPSGAPVAIDSMTGFVSQVEFADGSLWIPSRNALGDPRLQRALAPSAEEQRLTSIYRKKGLGAVVEELKKFQ